MAEPHGQLMRYKKRRRRPSLFLRLRARDGAFRAPARVTFFCCQKKVTKENHSNLRFKDPLARGGQVRIWRCVLAGGVQRSSLSVKRTVPAFTGAEADAAACLSHGRGICFYRVSDYQIAPLPPCGGKGRCARRARIYLFLSLRHSRTNNFCRSNRQRQRQRKAVLAQSGERQRSGKRRLREGKRGR